MDRKEIYSKLESIDGGESIKDAVKKILTDLDSDVKKYRESSEGLTTKLDDATTEIDALKKQMEDASSNSVPKTEMEKQISDMQKTLDIITGERDEQKALNEKAIEKQKTDELHKFFYDSVAESYGAVGANDAVTVSSSKLGYDDDGNMMYNGKTGEEATELFKVDTSRFMQNNGHNTQGGNVGAQDNFIEGLREQMMRD